MTWRHVIAVWAAVFAVAFYAGSAEAAVWHGHTVTARFDGQIDASPCPDSSCLKGLVGVYVDGMDVADHVVRCAWPKHPRVVDFDHGRHHHRVAWFAKIRTCGRYYWWRFR